jgi:hypothetical protein
MEPSRTVDDTLWVNERSGAAVAIGADGLIVSPEDGGPFVVRYADVTGIGLTRLAAAPATDRPMPDLFVPSLFWSPPDGRPWFAAYGCTITARLNPPLNLVSIGLNPQGLVVDRGPIFRRFVDELHVRTGKSGARVEHRAGLPVRRAVRRALAASVGGLCVLLVLALLLTPTLPANVYLIGLGCMVALLGVSGGIYVWRSRLSAYDPAVLPGRWLPPPS